jgi:hypothetical protein
MNFDIFDRLIEGPRFKLLRRMRLTNELIITVPDFGLDVGVMFLHQCELFHQGLESTFNYQEPSEPIYAQLVDLMTENFEANNKLWFRENHLDAGEMEEIMPRGRDTGDAFFHEMIFSAFKNEDISGTWYDNLKEYSAQYETLLIERPALAHLIKSQKRLHASLTHSLICAVLVLLPEEEHRLAMLGLAPG